MRNDVDLMREMGSLAIASRLRRLSDQIMNDVGSIYEAKKVSINPRYFPLLSLLQEHREMGVTELAKALGLSHPAVSQNLRPLEEDELIVIRYLETDARCRKISLSEKAIRILEEVAPLWKEIRAAIEEVFLASRCDLIEGLNAVEDELSTCSLNQRVIREKITERNIASIHRWDGRYAANFVDLNREWIEESFCLEEADKVAFNAPESIPAEGGEIFFAKLGASIVGTCALRKLSEKEYRLEKLAVSSHARGKGIGRQLLQAALEHAKAVGSTKVSLQSAHSLSKAQSLYLSLGFTQVDGPKEGSALKRVDVFMEKTI